MNTNQNNGLNQTLLEMRSSLQALITLLDEELQTLAARNPDSMLALASRKQHLCEKLERLEARRSHLAANAEGALAAGESEELWQEVVELAACAQKKNNVNGIIAENGKRQTQHIIGVMQGRSGELLTYGASGTTVENDGDHSTIARA